MYPSPFAFFCFLFYFLLPHSPARAHFFLRNSSRSSCPLIPLFGWVRKPRSDNSSGNYNRRKVRRMEIHRAPGGMLRPVVAGWLHRLAPQQQPLQHKITQLLQQRVHTQRNRLLQRSSSNKVACWVSSGPPTHVTAGRPKVRSLLLPLLHQPFYMRCRSCTPCATSRCHYRYLHHFRGLLCCFCIFTVSPFAACARSRHHTALLLLLLLRHIQLLAPAFPVVVLALLRRHTCFPVATVVAPTALGPRQLLHLARLQQMPHLLYLLPMQPQQQPQVPGIWKRLAGT